MIKKWEEFREQHVETMDIIEAGLMKLESYQNHTDLTPAYSIAMRASLSSSTFCYFSCHLVIDPSIKLDWHRENMPERVDWVKQVFIEKVSIMSKISLYCFSMNVSSVHITKKPTQMSRPSRIKHKLHRRQQKYVREPRIFLASIALGHRLPNVPWRLKSKPSLMIALLALTR
jgi:hypothetical protein